MSHESCGFCQKLSPLARNRAGQPSRCPACKHEIWIGPGATYRLVDDEPGCCRGWQVAGVASLSIILLALAGKSLWPMKPAVTPISVAHEPAAEVPLVETPRNEIQIVEFNKKWPIPSYAARVKAPGDGIRPKLPPDAKGWDKGEPGPLMAQENLPRVKEKTALAAPRLYPVSLRQHPFGVPEVDLEPNYMKYTGSDLQKLAKNIEEQTQKERDGFVRGVVATRPDLAGLPFLLGQDCRKSSSEAAALQKWSRSVREALNGRIRSASQHSAPEQSQMVDLESRSVRLCMDELQHSQRAAWDKGEMFPALWQILSVENRWVQLHLIKHLADNNSEQTTRLLTKTALFQCDREVHEEAVKALTKRPREQYLPILSEAFRYPWPPVVWNAVHAATTLEVKEAVPQLVELLAGPDPDSPYESGDKKMKVRELVRINHHRNCLLCHAPSFDRKDQVRAVVPSPQNELPPSLSPVYYSERRGDIVVRADITYLRQDFSLMQAVANPGKWPSMQRFDFFVRTRELTEEEAKRFPQPDATKPSEYKQTIAWALSELTGLSAPPEAAAWRAALFGWRSPGASAAKSAP